MEIYFSLAKSDHIFLASGQLILGKIAPQLGFELGLKFAVAGGQFYSGSIALGPFFAITTFLAASNSKTFFAFNKRFICHFYHKCTIQYLLIG